MLEGPEKLAQTDKQREPMNLEDAEFWTELVGRLCSYVEALTEKLEEIRKEQTETTRQLAAIAERLPWEGV